VITAKRCIVALPVTALRRNNRANHIEFIPRLPEAKTRAAETIQMGNAAKIFIGFRKTLWPENLFDVVCTNCFLPEFWITKYPDSPLPREATSSEEAARIAETRALITFFIAGDLADHLAKMDEKAIFDKAIVQLDAIFKTSCKEHVTTMKYVNWAQERLVQGAYTHPTVNAGDSRMLLAASVSNALFFAGEATHPGVNPCLQGAMETGARAAAQALASLDPPSSKL
jgi:monoamine oxidase